MESRKRDILLIVILAAWLFIFFDCFVGKAGSLEPDSPLGPTMVTLSELSAQVEGLSSPIKKVVRGVITFEKDGAVELMQGFLPAVDPSKSVVLLSDAVVSNQEDNCSDIWISRNGACLIKLTTTGITIRVERHKADQNVSYQIIEYK